MFSFKILKRNWCKKLSIILFQIKNLILLLSNTPKEGSNVDLRILPIKKLARQNKWFNLKSSAINTRIYCRLHFPISFKLSLHFLGFVQKEELTKKPSLASIQLPYFAGFILEVEATVLMLLKCLLFPYYLSLEEDLT